MWKTIPNTKRNKETPKMLSKERIKYKENVSKTGINNHAMNVVTNSKN